MLANNGPIMEQQPTLEHGDSVSGLGWYISL